MLITYCMRAPASVPTACQSAGGSNHNGTQSPLLEYDGILIGSGRRCRCHNEIRLMLLSDSSISNQLNVDNG